MVLAAAACREEKRLSAAAFLGDRGGQDTADGLEVPDSAARAGALAGRAGSPRLAGAAVRAGPEGRTGEPAWRVCATAPGLAPPANAVAPFAACLVSGRSLEVCVAALATVPGFSTLRARGTSGLAGPQTFIG